MGAEKDIRERFRAKFQGEPQIFRAPGRVNLIGEHTDYNDGLVMPAAIGFYCWTAIGARSDRKLVIASQEFGEQIEINLDSGARNQKPTGLWTDYPVGVVLQLLSAGVRLTGANLLLHGEVPMGAGLSSSASIEVATALALSEHAGQQVDRKQLARFCQEAENDFVGMRSGIMDQFIALHGRRSHALLLDCRSLDFELVRLPEAVRLVICNTGVKHQLAGSEYNRRRAECEEAVSALQRVLPGIRALRDVSREQLEEHRGLLSDVAYRRAEHVVCENQRVLDGARALRARDLRRFGRLMAESHHSLRDLYEVSCRELDVMVEIANQQPGLYGARMTGGGFGGATINLVEASSAAEFASSVAATYAKATGIAPQIYTCDPADGASRVGAAKVSG